MSSFDELIFPYYDYVLVTQTTKGIYGAINLSNYNFSKFITSMGNWSVKINWITDLAAINGSYASDYTFEVIILFDSSLGYVVQNVSINLIAGEDRPSIFESWHLQNDQQGTDSCFEFTSGIGSILYVCRCAI